MNYNEFKKYIQDNGITFVEKLVGSKVKIIKE